MTTSLLPWSAAPHGLPTHEVVLLLETDLNAGLTEAEAGERLTRYGPNALPEAESAGPLVRFARQLQHPLIYVLIASAAVTVALAEYVEAAVIAGVVLVNAIVGFVQESKAEAALDALRALVRTDAKVIRDGQAGQVPSERLVPGDLVMVDAGDKVPADLRLVRQSGLQVDESALTGESVPVAKDEVVIADATPVADRRNMVYSGTIVTSGSGTGIVVATGADTELGEIHRLVGSAEALSTPLTRKLATFSMLLTYLILGLAAVTFAAGVARGEAPSEMFTAAVALAVGAIPEGLPAAVTITLAIGVARMARRNAVIRRMPAVETLGSTTVICTDKTGALTENQMTVQAIWTPTDTYTVTGSGYDPAGQLFDAHHRRADVASDEALRWCLLAGAATNDATISDRNGGRHVVGDPTEAALLVAAQKAGLTRAGINTLLPRRATIPFSAERQYMATVHDDGNGNTVVLVKGALERLLPMCTTQMQPDGTLAPLDLAGATRDATDLARRGLRVLATATRRFDGATDVDERRTTTDLALTGVQAMLDPPRPAAAPAIAKCRTAGIEVKMITGDHATTATTIARRLGLLTDCDSRKSITGAELAALDDEAYAAAVNAASVFARVTPEQKLRLVAAHQQRGHVVAMTGDGVNDAPALRQADIGLAMGHGGTEVAKEAADMVLTDDDFATIEAAVEEGRGVFDNLTKFIVWTLPTNMAEGLVIFVAIVLGRTLPILPLQILWINMTTAVALGLMLAFEPKEQGIMARPPRDPNRPLLTGALALRILLVSALLIAGTLWLFEWERGRGADLDETRTICMNLFVAIEAVYLVHCRTLIGSVRQVGLFSNRWVLGGIATQATAQLAMTYLPAMNAVFGTAPIGLAAWLRIAGLTALCSLIVVTVKRLRPGVL